MKIYINENYEIKAINSTDDELLEEIEVNRNDVFGDKSDFMILNTSISILDISCRNNMT